MKRAPSPATPRPKTGTRAVPRSRSEAAVELVRTEFDIARLERQLHQLDRQRRIAMSELNVVRARSAKLLAQLENSQERTL